MCEYASTLCMLVQAGFRTPEVLDGEQDMDSSAPHSGRTRDPRRNGQESLQQQLPRALRRGLCSAEKRGDHSHGNWCLPWKLDQALFRILQQDRTAPISLVEYFQKIAERRLAASSQRPQFRSLEIYFANAVDTIQFIHMALTIRKATEDPGTASRPEKLRPFVEEPGDYLNWSGQDQLPCQPRLVAG